jgi:hypothetical protein
MKTKMKIDHQQSTIPFAPAPQKKAVLSSTFFPAQTVTNIAIPIFTNSKPFFGN